MTERLRKLSRLAVAIGGFLIMTGMILMSAIALTLLNIVDISALVNETYLIISMIALLLVGVLDLIAGIILSRG